MPVALISSTVPKLNLIAVVDVLVTALLIYQFLMIVRGRRAAPILSGIFVLVLVYVVAVWARLELLRWVIATVAPYTAFALIVMFQSEIRRMLARIGLRRWLSSPTRMQRYESAEEILLALEHLAHRNTGALVVVEREIGLRTFIESGVQLDAALTRDLLLSIFQPGGPLHDGAVIVHGNRVAAAGCFLPLTMNPNLMTTLGTRHRAAIGITEEADCVAVLVSEENGWISIATGGELESNVTLDRARECLTGEPARSKARPGGESVTAGGPAGEAERGEAGNR